jgi:hypothetical protein
MKKNEYLGKAKSSITVAIDGIPVVANVKVFSTGSVGYNANGKITLPLANGEVVKYQLSLNLTAVGSKEWEQDAA